MKASRTITTAILLLLSLCSLAQGHGGKLHPGSPETNNFARVKVAACSNWQAASGRLRDGKVSPVADRRAPVEVKGTVSLWQYLYKNCSVAEGEEPSAGAVFNVTITRGGNPVSGLTVDGQGMTGSCASKGESTFFFNPALKPAADTKDNKLWFTNYTTLEAGEVAGNGANDGVIRMVASKDGKPAVKSMMLIETKTGALLACCDLVPEGPATSNWVKALPKGTACAKEDHSAHGAAPAGASAALLASATPKNATGAKKNATDMHDGHHEGDGHDHGPTTNNTTKATKSAAGTVSAGVAASCAAVVAAVALLVL